MDKTEKIKLDIDELIKEFAKGEMTTLADMKQIWLSKKFSYIFEAKPSTNLGFFMQSLYGHCLGYMASTSSLSYKLGGLYCLYCLHETQPFKPPFRIYICTREIRRLKELTIDAKKENIGVVHALINHMLERNLFFYGAIDLQETSVAERVNELTDIQNARVQHANKKLFADTQIERYIHMDMGSELDIDLLKKMSTDYAVAKELAIKEAEKVVDVQEIKHIAENQILIGDVVGKTTQDWNSQREVFHQQTGRCLPENQPTDNENLEEQQSNENLELVVFDENLTEEGNGNAENLDNFGDELEQQLLSLADFE